MTSDRDVVNTCIYFWNAGAEPLRSADVLSPGIQLVVAGDHSEIISADVVKQTREGIEVSVAPQSPNGQNSRTLVFKALDEDDAAAIHVEYIAPKGYNVSIEGTLLGSRIAIAPAVGRSTDVDQFRSSLVTYRTFALMLLIWSGIVLPFAIRSKLWKTTCVFVVFIVVCVVAPLLHTYGQAAQLPPSAVVLSQDECFGGSIR